MQCPMSEMQEINEVVPEAFTKGGNPQRAMSQNDDDVAY